MIPKRKILRKFILMKVAKSPKICTHNNIYFCGRFHIRFWELNFVFMSNHYIKFKQHLKSLSITCITRAWGTSVLLRPWHNLVTSSFTVGLFPVKIDSRLGVFKRKNLNLESLVAISFLEGEIPYFWFIKWTQVTRWKGCHPYPPLGQVRW